MRFFASLPIGTRVIADRDFGPIIKGQLGIITDLVRSRRGLWRRAVHVCTFLGGIRVTARRTYIKEYDHGYSCELLEDPFWFLQTRQAAGIVGQHSVEVRRPPN